MSRSETNNIMRIQMGNTSSNKMPVSILKRTYAEKISRIVAKYNFTKMNSPYDTVCAFYYDDVNKFLWLAQNIGDECPLFTKPTHEIILEMSGLHMIHVDFEKQHNMFHP